VPSICWLRLCAKTRSRSCHAGFFNPTQIARCHLRGYLYQEHSTANTADWRWRKPDAELALTVIDVADKSEVQLPVQRRFFEKIFIGSGYLALAFVLYLYVLLMQRGAGVPEYLGGLVFVFFSMALLHVGSRVSSVILYPDHLVVIRDYGFVLHNTHIFRHDPATQFDGRPESVFELTVDHEAPDFKLYVKRPGFWFLTRKKKFVLAINQSQGSWLVAGLNDWRAHARPAQVGRKDSGKSAH
jgi:hypothetical protein